MNLIYLCVYWDYKYLSVVFVTKLYIWCFLGFCMSLRAVYERLKLHVLDCTSLCTIGNPFFGTYEKLVLGMDNDSFLKARLIATGTSYLGMGFLFAGGREISRKVFGVNKDSPEKKQEIHDAAYAMAFNTMLGPIIYGLSGADLKQILYGTAFAVATAIPTGIAAGYALDAGRDLAGFDESPRLPKRISGLSPWKKKGLYAAAVAASLGIIGLLYRVPSEKPAGIAKQPTLEQRIDK
jgi:hypothetical protein